MIAIDTSALIGSFAGARASLRDLERLLGDRDRLLLSAIVLYEWKRGPRTELELGLQEEFLPSISAVPFGASEAEIAATLYRSIPRARSRTMDIAIAATAISHRASLWTLNREDFADIPGLKLVD